MRGLFCILHQPTPRNRPFYHGISYISLVLNEQKKTFRFHERSFQRQRADSNRRIRVLQTRPLPTWVRRHNCGCNISNYLAEYKGKVRKKSKKIAFCCPKPHLYLFFTRETYHSEDKTPRRTRRTLDEEPPDPPDRPRRFSARDSRFVAQGPACQLRRVQGQERPHSRFGIKGRGIFCTSGQATPLYSHTRIRYARSNQREAPAQVAPRQPLCRHGARRSPRPSPPGKTRFALAIQGQRTPTLALLHQVRQAFSPERVG